MSYRRLRSVAVAIFALGHHLTFATVDGFADANRPDIVLIAVDDLNDWVGCLDGHPQAITPNIDRLADRGTLFTNAHCQAPVCNPSRASMMTGLSPETTGIYFLNPPIAQSPVAAAVPVMPRRFAAEGYQVRGVGKLFHGGENGVYIDDYGTSFGGAGPRRKKKLTTFPGHPLWDWGIFENDDKDMPDYKIASWATNALSQPSDRPLWFGVGFHRPHVPQYAPKKWFDLYPSESVRLPKVLEEDLGDVGPYGTSITRREHVAPTHQWVLDNDEWKPLVRSYLACVSFVDAQVGRVIDAIDARPNAKNTYIVLYSDHGFHLGEKQRWAKRSLWNDGTRVLMIVVGPNVTAGVRCDAPVQLMDIYPTVLDVAGLPPQPEHEGHSLRPLLRDPEAAWEHVAKCTFGPDNVSIISKTHQYIHYVDGSEELYDRQNDPHQWHNVVESSRHRDTLDDLRKRLPTHQHPILGSGSTGHLSFEASKVIQHPTEPIQR